MRVHASSVNAADWYGLNGRPYIARPLMGMRKPKSSALGSDFAGVVEAVGGGVDGFAPGDEVYGCEGGAFAEYVIASDAVERKPANMSFEEAAAVPLAALTALQGLRDHGGCQAGAAHPRERRGRRCRHVRRAGREGTRRRGACGLQRRNVEQARSSGPIVSSTTAARTSRERRPLRRAVRQRRQPVVASMTRALKPTGSCCSSGGRAAVACSGRLAISRG